MDRNEIESTLVGCDAVFGQRHGGEMEKSQGKRLQWAARLNVKLSLRSFDYDFRPFDQMSQPAISNASPKTMNPPDAGEARHQRSVPAMNQQMMDAK